ncbi:MAG: UDP-N-acetylmuramate dehydrogenase [Terriglobia bacterium]
MSHWVEILKVGLAGRFRGEILEAEPLKHWTTYCIGGPVRVLACPADLQELQLVLTLLRKHRIRWFVLGGGANVLSSDAGFDGVAIHLKNFNQLELNGLEVRAGAGLVLDSLVVKCLKRGLAGLEKLSGIPGTLGGALRMNAGAFGAEISDFLLSVECLDENGEHRILNKREVGFSYRSAPAIRNHIILGGTFEFPKGDKERLFKIRHETLAQRHEKQPWQFPTAGSVFKRPPGHYVGKLIEDLGLKGTKMGEAQISPKHAGIIVNLGNARASDVLALIRFIQAEVKAHYGIELEMEQELIGFES